jgi:hypothetical protein
MLENKYLKIRLKYNRIFFIIMFIFWFLKKRKMMIYENDIKILKSRRGQEDIIEDVIFNSNIKKIWLENKPNKKAKKIESLLIFYLHDGSKKEYLVGDDFAEKFREMLGEFEYPQIKFGKKK